MKLHRSIIPRRWQVEALNAWSKRQRGIARVVTGGGKTVFSYLCLEEFFAKHSDGRAVIVVPTLALLDQWFLDLCDATDLEKSDIASFSGVSRPEQPARVNIVVLNTARRVAPQIADSTPTFLIVDECHRIGTAENSRALEGLHEATLGLSATPERESDDGFESLIVPALGPIIHEYDYVQAKADGVIVDFKLVNVEIALDGNEINKLPNLSRSRDARAQRSTATSEQQRLHDVASEKVARSAEQAIRVPWAVKLALHHSRERVIVFHERVASLARITNLLSEYGQNSVAYHSHLAESHRRDNLRMFRRGMINMLVTCRALDEGANVPETNIAIIARSTSSVRQRIQRLGRVLRPAAGKEHAIVYTLYAGENQRELLANEAVKLEGVSKVTWKKGTLQ